MRATSLFWAYVAYDWQYVIAMFMYQDIKLYGIYICVKCFNRGLVDLATWFFL